MTDHLTEEQKAAIRKNLRKWRVQHTPVVTIFVRHSEDCKYAGDEFCKRCDCSKHLRWTQDRKQVRISAHTRSWAEADRKKRELEDQLAGRVPVTKPREAQRDIRKAVIDGRFKEIPAGLRAMQRLWTPQSGLWLRREREAKLFEDGLAEGRSASSPA